LSVLHHFACACACAFAVAFAISISFAQPKRYWVFNPRIRMIMYLKHLVLICCISAVPFILMMMHLSPFFFVFIFFILVCFWVHPLGCLSASSHLTPGPYANFIGQKASVGLSHKFLYDVRIRTIRTNARAGKPSPPPPPFSCTKVAQHVAACVHFICNYNQRQLPLWHF